MGPTTVGTMVLVVVTILVSVEIPTMDQLVPAKDVSCVLKYYVLLYIYSIAKKFSGRKFSDFCSITFMICWLIFRVCVLISSLVRILRIDFRELSQIVKNTKF